MTNLAIDGEMYEGLVLSRKRNEVIVIDLRQYGLGLINVLVTEIRGDKARLMVSCDRKIPVHRLEVFDVIEGREPRKPKPATDPLPGKSLRERVRKSADTGLE